MSATSRRDLLDPTVIGELRGLARTGVAVRGIAEWAGFGSEQSFTEALNDPEFYLARAAVFDCWREGERAALSNIHNVARDSTNKHHYAANVWLVQRFEALRASMPKGSEELTPRAPLTDDELNDALVGALGGEGAKTH